jgi:hypothetical protein
MRFLAVGNSEGFKAAVHGSAAALCALMGLYNGAALAYRVLAESDESAGDLLAANKHLMLNTALYAAAFAWEVRQTARHLERAEHQTQDQARIA